MINLRDFRLDLSTSNRGLVRLWRRPPFDEALDSASDAAVDEPSPPLLEQRDLESRRIKEWSEILGFFLLLPATVATPCNGTRK